MVEKSKKTCFFVTPIGEKGTDIRNEIEDIYELVIKPVFSENFHCTVAHKLYDTGSITDKIIRDLYTSDLVIVNLTGLNPNVMYELAIRYTSGKPTILIADEKTTASLPFDIQPERTISFERGVAGGIKLKADLEHALKGIDFSQWKETSPIHKALRELKTEVNVYNRLPSEDKEVYKILIEKIDLLKKQVSRIDEIVQTRKSSSDNRLYCRIADVQGRDGAGIVGALAEIEDRIFNDELSPFVDNAKLDEILEMSDTVFELVIAGDYDALPISMTIKHIEKLVREHGFEIAN
ncbi:MAG: hypothetical protein ACOYJB_03655 [Christensenellaceae bacterium]|jgi:hypothetical protein